MKWIGALLFIITTTWAGFEWSRRLSNRPKHIRQLKSTLQILEAEILYSQSPLKDAFLTISKQIPEPTKGFYKRLHSNMEHNVADLTVTWEKCVDHLIKSSSLGMNEAEILKQFGRTIGQHDFSQQQKYIRLAITHLERELDEATVHQVKYANMAKSLGLLTGLFIVLIFI